MKTNFKTNDRSKNEKLQPRFGDGTVKIKANNANQRGGRARMLPESDEVALLPTGKLSGRTAEWKSLTVPSKQKLEPS